MSFQLTNNINKDKIFLVSRSCVQERLDVQYHRENFDFTGYHHLYEYVYINGGKRIPKGLKYNVDSDSPYLYLRVADLTDDHIDYDNVKRIDKELYQILHRYAIHNGEIALSIAGSIGKVFLLHTIPEEYKIILTENCAKISVRDPEHLYPEYLAILLTLPIVQKQIMLNYIQTTIPKLSLERLGKIMIPSIPSKDKQRSIIDIYYSSLLQKQCNYKNAESLLDSINEYLINTLRISIPETDTSLNNRMFISSFRKIEGHRIDPIFSLYSGKDVQSECYENIPLRTIAYISKGSPLTSAEIEEGNIPVIAGGQTSPYCHNSSNFNGNVITVSASGAYAGYVWYHDYPIFATDCCVIMSKNENRFITKYLFEVLKLQQKAIYRLQTGAAQPHVYAADLQMLNIPNIPIEKQHEIVDYIYKIRSNAKILQEEGRKILDEAKHEIEKQIMG